MSKNKEDCKNCKFIHECVNVNVFKDGDCTQYKKVRKPKGSKNG